MNMDTGRAFWILYARPLPDKRIHAVGIHLADIEDTWPLGPQWWTAEEFRKMNWEYARLSAFGQHA